MDDKSAFLQLKEDEREIRKSIIIEATFRLFKKKNFHKIGMRDIAREAGVSAASIYRYFPSRDDLFVEALIKEMGKIKIRLKKAFDSGHNTMDEISFAVIDYLIDNEATFQLMCHFLTRKETNKRVQNKFNAAQIYFINLFDNIIQTTEKKNQLFFSHAFFAAITGVVLTYLHYPGITKKKRREYMYNLTSIIIKTGDPELIIKKES
jgi:AcrR family transcriptional regulator